MRDGLPPDWNERISEETGTDISRAKIIAASLLKESDRGSAIFSAAILHDDLEILLRAFCRKDEGSVKSIVDPLFQGYAPLATFSARIQIAYAMRLIPSGLYRKLEIVKRLRNDFAHESGPLDFRDSRCQSRLRLLIGERVPGDTRDDDDLMTTVGAHALTRREFVERTAFVLAISALSSRLFFIIEHIRDGNDVHAIVAALENAGK